MVRIGECDGKTQKEKGREHNIPESEYFLMQLSAALGFEDGILV